MLAGGAIEGLSFLASWWAGHGLATDPGSLRLVSVAAVLSLGLSPLPWPLVLVAPLVLFPDGRARTPRWRWFLVVVSTVVGLLAIAAATVAIPVAIDRPLELLDLPGTPGTGVTEWAIRLALAARLVGFGAAIRAQRIGSARARTTRAGRRPAAWQRARGQAGDRAACAGTPAGGHRALADRRPEPGRGGGRDASERQRRRPQPQLPLPLAGRRAPVRHLPLRLGPALRARVEGARRVRRARPSARHALVPPGAAAGRPQRRRPLAAAPLRPSRRIALEGAAGLPRHRLVVAEPLRSPATPPSSSSCPAGACPRTGCAATPPPRWRSHAPWRRRARSPSRFPTAPSVESRCAPTRSATTASTAPACARRKVIVEHYTATDTFAPVFDVFAANEPDVELGELPGVCSHYVIDRDGTIYQLVPTRLMCRHTVGLNYTAIGIEHVGTSDAQLLGNRRQLRASLRLTRMLQGRFEHRHARRDRACREPLEPVSPRARGAAAHADPRRPADRPRWTATGARWRACRPRRACASATLRALARLRRRRSSA